MGGEVRERLQWYAYNGMPWLHSFLDDHVPEDWDVYLMSRGTLGYDLLIGSHYVDV